MLRKAIAMVIVGGMVALVPVQGVQAAPQQARGLTTGQMHQAVKDSHDKAAAARAAVDGVLARAEVQQQLRHLGLAPERVRARAALLGDAEVMELQQHMMTAGLQQSASGLSSGAIVAIVAAGVAGTVLLYWLALREVDDEYYY